MNSLSDADSVQFSDIIRQLRNRNVALRISAVKTIGQLGPKAVKYIDELFESVNDSDESVRLAAAQAICQTGPNGLPAISRLLSHSDKYVRRQAVWGIGRLGAQAAPILEDLICSLKDADPRTATGAAQAIGEMGEAGANAVPALADAMKGTNVVLCRLSAKALSMIGMPALTTLLADLSHHDIFVRGEAAMAIGWIGPKAACAIPALLQILRIPSPASAPANPNDSTPPSTEDAARTAAAMALGRIGKAAKIAEPDLVHFSSDVCSTVRQACEQALRSIRTA